MIRRRDFLKALGGAAAGAGLAFRWGRSGPGDGPQREVWPTGIERGVLSACRLCPGGCGIRVRIVDDRPVGIAGNPLHPVNRGRLCPRGLAGLQLLYHPDRIRGPLRRSGERGSGSWRAVTWDEAISAIGRELAALRAEGRPEGLVLLHGEPAGLLERWARRFLEAYGSPNYIRTPPPDGMARAVQLMQGVEGMPGYDLEETDLILSFGSGLLDDWRSPVHAHRTYGYLRQGRPGRRARLIEIGPRFSMTAAKADQWIRCAPGSEGAVALGIAYVLIKEALYDREFVERFTEGFENRRDSERQRHRGYRAVVLEEGRPEVVAAVSGVPVDALLRLAKEVASHPRRVAIAGWSSTTHTGGTYAGLAIHALNALLGAIDRPGGTLVSRLIPWSEWPRVEADDVARRGLARPRIDGAGGPRFPLSSDVPDTLVEAALSDAPYPPRALLLLRANPALTSPASSRYPRALSRVPLVVSFTPLMDESARWADWILPEPTYLEVEEDVSTGDVLGRPVVGLARPAAGPLHATRHAPATLQALAQSCGGAVAGAYPFSDFGEALRSAARGLFEAGRGTVFTDVFEEAQVRLLEERGFWIPAHPSADAFWKALEERGGWWDPAYHYGEWGRVLRTPSGRFEFAPRALARALRGEGPSPRGESALLPHYEPPRIQGDPDDYPLILLPFRLLALWGGEGGELPWLQEIAGMPAQRQWDSWVEVHPERAAALGVGEGDEVWVESPRGRMRSTVRLTEGSHPEAVHIPLGWGRSEGGRWARGRGVHPYALLGAEYDYLSGWLSPFATRVRLVPVRRA